MTARHQKKATGGLVFCGESKVTIEEINSIAFQVTKVDSQDIHGLWCTGQLVGTIIDNIIGGIVHKEYGAVALHLQNSSTGRKEILQRIAESQLQDEVGKNTCCPLFEHLVVYLGKEMLTVQKLDKLIARITSGEAATIGEALALESGK